MTTILQINPPIHAHCPKGECFLRFIIDYGFDINPVFVVDLFDTRQCLNVDSNEIWFGENGMYDLQKPEIPKERQI